MPRYITADFIEAIPKSGGIITTIAKRVGCDWNIAKKWITNYPTVQRAYVAEAETVTDMAESNLFKAMKSGDPWALKFYLATKGKERGYVQRVEEVIKGDPNAPIGIAYVNNWRPDHSPLSAQGPAGGDDAGEAVQLAVGGAQVEEDDAGHGNSG